MTRLPVTTAESLTSTPKSRFLYPTYQRQPLLLDAPKQAKCESYPCLPHQGRFKTPYTTINHRTGTNVH